MHGSGTLLCPNQIQPTMDLEVDQRDSGSEGKWPLPWPLPSRLVMFFRLALLVVPPALALLLRRVAVGDMGRFFFGMTTTARANVRAAWRLNQDLLVDIPIPDCLSMYMRACLIPSTQVVPHRLFNVF